MRALGLAAIYSLLKATPDRVDVVIDAQETVGTLFELVPLSVCAVFVKIDGGGGAVRVNSVPVKNVVTGLKQGTGFVIVVIPSGETCRLYGQPSVR